MLTVKLELIRLILDLCRGLASLATEAAAPKRDNELRSLLFLGLSAGAVAGAGSFACAAFGGGTFSAGIDGGCDTDIFMDVVAREGSTTSGDKELHIASADGAPVQGDSAVIDVVHRSAPVLMFAVASLAARWDWILERPRKA